MAKPTVLEHRTDIRAYVQEMAAAQFTDIEVDANLANALNVLSGYVIKYAKVNKTGLTTNQTLIDLATDCPAESVVEIVPTGLASITDFRARGTELVLNKQVGATAADFVYRSRYTHDGTNVDWYPPQYRGAVCMLAAALLIYGRQREMAETDALKANAMPAAAARMFDTAVAIMSNRPQTTSSSTYTSRTA
jgi:hypothetical protein